MHTVSTATCCGCFKLNFPFFSRHASSRARWAAQRCLVMPQDFHSFRPLTLLRLPSIQSVTEKHLTIIHIVSVANCSFSDTNAWKLIHTYVSQTTVASPTNAGRHFSAELQNRCPWHHAQKRCCPATLPGGTDDLHWRQWDSNTGSPLLGKTFNQWVTGAPKNGD